MLTPHLFRETDRGLQVAEIEERFVMVRIDCWLVLLVFVGAWSGSAAPLAAQSTLDSKSAPTRTAEESAPNPLQGLPRPPDQPSTMLAPPPAQPYSEADPMPPCYFEVDPRLDPPCLPPGWLTSVDATIGVPRILNRLRGTVQNPVTGNTDVIQTESAAYNATVMPRIELGYRLPSGFGEIDLAYRGLGASGTSQALLLDGLGDLHSRLDIQIVDLDYASREFSLGDGWGMKWRVGLRFSWVYFDSLATQNFAAASAGSGILDQRETNQYIGGGPHAGMEISRDLHWGGLSILGRTDLSQLIGRVKQGYFEDILPLGGNGQPLLASNPVSSSQSAPMVLGQLGIAWQPPGWSNVRVFAGYEIEYWWNVGRLSDINAGTSLYFQGALLQAQINY
jgi:Legionella pneumophila major outer membrane protein precursor